ncbi:glycoside hydrolase family 3 N-terminal domain-containing protein [Kribbella flavida]|nr:glycoside hydrolase family 3 N-terminal domain-containing protein [Kribbella flavida]
MKTFPGVAVVAATALLLAGCSSGGSPTAGPSTVPSSTVPLSPSDPPPATDTPSRSPSQTPSTPPNVGCLEQKLAGLTLRERAAQLIMTGIASTGMTSAERSVVRERKPGGVLLMGSGGSLDHTRSEMAAVRSAATIDGIQPFVAADQEGGKIQRLKGSGFDRIPAATEQATWTPQKLTAEATTWGRQLKRAGVNVDLAPVADVVPESLGDDNAPIGALDRGYGSTPDAVGPHVAAFIRGMDAAGVMTSVKHFPGLGRVRGNTDFSAGVVDTVTVRGDADLGPFAAGIEAGSDMVMISTVTYTEIDPDNRAVFSPIVIQGMLRRELRFGGVVITDDVGAAAEVASVPAGERATRFIGAGGDVVITARAGLTGTMIDAVVRKAQRDKAFAAQVEASVRRVLVLKQNRGLMDCG